MCADAVEWLRMESGGLENRCRGFLYHGFESPSLRHLPHNGLLPGRSWLFPRGLRHNCLAILTAVLTNVNEEVRF